MRFCEYFENYRVKKGYSYIGIARRVMLDQKTIAAHCHGKSFPHFETFVEYILRGILDYADLINTVSPGRTYETMYDAIPDLYYYFKQMEQGVQ